MSLQGSLFTAKLLAENVIKVPSSFSEVNQASSLVPVIAQGSGSTLGFNPNKVRIDEASGGFGTVVEIAAYHCLKVLDQSLNPPDQIHLNGDPITAMLIAPHDPFELPRLNDLAVFLSTHISYLGFLYADFTATTFKPIAITFEDEHQLSFVYEAQVVVAISHATQDEPSSLSPVSFSPDPLLNPGFSLPIPQNSAATQAFMVRSRRLSAAGRDALSQFGITRTPETAIPFIGGPIGKVNIKVKCPYTYVASDYARCVDVYAVLSQAEVVVTTPTDDVKRLYDAGLFGMGGTLLTSAILTRDQAPLVPTISMVGVDHVGAQPVEFEHFDAAVFHVTAAEPPQPAKMPFRALSLQAMVVAVNLKPGCHGIIEDVSYFVGSSDFAVITDEARIERLFKYKWRTGCFFQRFPLSQSIQIQRDSEVESATLNGYLELDSLGVVSLETAANSGDDVVKLGGSATVHAEYIELNDGTQIHSGDASGVDFGNPDTVAWVFVASVKLGAPAIEKEPLLQAFHAVATHVAFRHIGRPFVLPENAADISYVRTQSVSKQVFMMGNFNL